MVTFLLLATLLAPAPAPTLSADPCAGMDCEAQMGSMTCADLCDIIEDIEAELRRVDAIISNLFEVLRQIPDLEQQALDGFGDCMGDPNADMADCLLAYSEALSDISDLESSTSEQISSWREVHRLLKEDHQQYSQIKACCCP